MSLTTEDIKVLADIIEQMIARRLDKLENRTYRRGVVASVNGQIADVYIEGSTVATEKIRSLRSYTPVVGHVVLVLSIGRTGANQVILGRID